MENSLDKSTACPGMRTVEALETGGIVFHFHWNMGHIRTLCPRGFFRSYLKIITN